MDGIAQGIEDRADLVIDLVGQRHDVEGGQPQILRERPLLIDADTACLGVEVELARAALTRGFADQMPLAADPLAKVQVLHIAAEFDDLASEFMARHQRHRHGARRPFVPVPDMDIGAANAGLVDPDQHVILANLRHRDVIHPKAGFGAGFDQGLHLILHDRTPVSRPALPKASNARSSCSRVRAAFIWVRMRALSLGTTGKKNPAT